jgi:hypothetical protein
MIYMFELKYYFYVNLCCYKSTLIISGFSTNLGYLHEYNFPCCSILVFITEVAQT